MGKKIFIDTNPLIYLVSGQEPYCKKVMNFMSDCIENDCEFYTSTITDAEFLTKPFLRNDFEQVRKYKTYIVQLDFLKCYINESVAENAARLRVKYPEIKLADALQLASSIECNCDIFFTNDKQLKHVKEANVLYLGNL